MPGPLHQGLVYLLRNHPRLAFELAAQFDPRFTPPGQSSQTALRIEVADGELPDPAHAGTILHADGVVATLTEESFRPGTSIRRHRRRFGRGPHHSALAIEAQTSVDWFKLVSWLSHAAGVRGKFFCRGWTIVFCPISRVREKYQKMFEQEPRASPWFVTPEMIPVVTTVEQARADWPMAVLACVFHSHLPHIMDSILATLTVLHELAPSDLPIYIDLVTSSLDTQQLSGLPKYLLEIDFDAPLSRLEKRNGFYVRGRADGRQEGLAEGLAEGREKGIAEGRVIEQRRSLLHAIRKR
ncbi:MAG: hypothetical protein KC431_00990, partial [Myxococcales bacterium]|nr:hypothetical protein [Myxococcales bacterium]